MKLFIVLLIAGSLWAQQPQEQFKAEKLTAEEVRHIAAARAEFDKAKAELEAAERDAQYAHGQTSPGFHCNSPITSVEIRGEWALISTAPPTSCIALTTSH